MWCKLTDMICVSINGALVAFN
uniref:Uncharacterized protein n=1 Tax=Anguilla anguilla TaxID=7936 RepID=A0A0E9SP38_ANGAN